MPRSPRRKNTKPITIVHTVNAPDRTTESTTGEGRCALGGVIFLSHSGSGLCGAAAAESIACLTFEISLGGTCVATSSTNTPSATTPTDPTPMTQPTPRVSGRWRLFPTTDATQIASIATIEAPNVTNTDPTASAMPPTAAPRCAFVTAFLGTDPPRPPPSMTPIDRVCTSRSPTS